MKVKPEASTEQSDTGFFHVVPWPASVGGPIFLPRRRTEFDGAVVFLLLVVPVGRWPRWAAARCALSAAGATLRAFRPAMTENLKDSKVKPSLRCGLESFNDRTE